MTYYLRVSILHCGSATRPASQTNQIGMLYIAHSYCCKCQCPTPSPSSFPVLYLLLFHPSTNSPAWQSNMLHNRQQTFQHALSGICWLSLVTQVQCVTFCSLLDFFFNTLPVIAPAGENCIPASESVPNVTCFLGPSALPASSLGVLRADPDPEPGVPDFTKLPL